MSTFNDNIRPIHTLVGSRRYALDEISQLTSSVQRVNTSSGTFNKERFFGDADSTVLTGVESVDTSVRIMDVKHKTSFYDWIKNPDNVEYIAQHMKHLVEEYQDESDGVEVVSRAIAWIISQWSINAIASLLIKLFYEHGLSNVVFGRVVSALLSGREWCHIVDLNSTLLIGEDSKVAAKYLKIVTQDYSRETVVDLIMSVSARSRWTKEFMQDFLLNFTDELRTADLHSTDNLKSYIVEQFATTPKVTRDNDTVYIGGQRQLLKSLLNNILIPETIAEPQIQVKDESFQVKSPIAGRVEIVESNSQSLQINVSKAVSTPLSSPLSLMSPKSPLSDR